MTEIVVAGGGIAGLVAAREAALAGATVTLVEPGPLGGKVRASSFDGAVLDEAADNFLARVPEGLELCRALGLEGDLVSPAARRARVWSRGELRLLPEAQLLGVPTDLDELARVADPVARGCPTRPGGPHDAAHRTDGRRHHRLGDARPPRRRGPRATRRPARGRDQRR